MIGKRDGCVGCPPEMGCMGRGCPYMDVEVTVCDKCRSDAVCNIDGEDLCEDCAQRSLIEMFQMLSLREQAELLDVEYRGLE